jgi:hypothetical protein
VVLVIERRASSLLDKCFTIWAILVALCFSLFLDRVLYFCLGWPQTILLSPSPKLGLQAVPPCPVQFFSFLHFFWWFFFIVLGGGTLWHLQKFLYHLNSPLHHSPLSPPPLILRIVSTGLIFTFTHTCTQYLHHIHPPTPFPHHLPPPTGTDSPGPISTHSQAQILWTRVPSALPLNVLFPFSFLIFLV